MSALKIMTYNMLHIDNDPANDWNKRKYLIRLVIDREDPDVIGTQECLYTQIQDLLHLLPDYDWIGLGRLGGSNDDYMAIFYKRDRITLLAYDHFWLSDTPRLIGSMSFGNKLPRMVTWAKFADKHSGKIFYHLNTHLDYISEVARIKAAGLICEKVKELEPNIPVFLTGDFNTDIKTIPFHMLTKEGLFTDTWDLAQEHINQTNGTKNDFIYQDGGDQRIDWILVKERIVVNRIKIVTDCPGGVFPSDHFPVIADCVF